MLLGMLTSTCSLSTIEGISGRSANSDILRSPIRFRRISVRPLFGSTGVAITIRLTSTTSLSSSTGGEKGRCRTLRPPHVRMKGMMKRMVVVVNSITGEDGESVCPSVFSDLDDLSATR